jgi:hypothetical protein
VCLSSGNKLELQEQRDSRPLNKKPNAFTPRPAKCLARNPDHKIYFINFPFLRKKEYAYETGTLDVGVLPFKMQLIDFHEIRYERYNTGDQQHLCQPACNSYITNITDMQTSEMDATLAPINTGHCNEVWQQMFDTHAAFLGHFIS